MPEPHLLIGDVARMLQVSTATLRTWEKVKKLEPAGRTDGGRRFYTHEQIEAFVRKSGSGKYERYDRYRVSGE